MSLCESKDSMSSKVPQHLKENSKLSKKVLPHPKDNMSSKATPRLKEVLKLRERNGATYQVPNDWEELYESESECPPALQRVETESNQYRCDNIDLESYEILRSSSGQYKLIRKNQISYETRLEQIGSFNTRNAKSNSKSGRNDASDKRSQKSGVRMGVSGSKRYSKNNQKNSNERVDSDVYVKPLRNRVVTLGDYIPSFKDRLRVNNSPKACNRSNTQGTPTPDYNDIFEPRESENVSERYWDEDDVSQHYTPSENDRIFSALDKQIKDCYERSEALTKERLESYNSHYNTQEIECVDDPNYEHSQGDDVYSYNRHGELDYVSPSHSNANINDNSETIIEDHNEIYCPPNSADNDSANPTEVPEIPSWWKIILFDNIRKAFANAVEEGQKFVDSERKFNEIPKYEYSGENRIPLCIHGILYQAQRFSDALFRESEIIVCSLPQIHLKMFAEAVKTLALAVEDLRFCNLRRNLSDCNQEYCRWNDYKPSSNVDTGRRSIFNFSSTTTHDLVSFEIKLTQAESLKHRLDTLLTGFDERYDIYKEPDIRLRRKYRTALETLEAHKLSEFRCNMDRFTNAIFREAFILLESLPKEEAEEIRRSFRTFNGAAWEMREIGEKSNREELRRYAFSDLHKTEDDEVSTDSESSLSSSFIKQLIDNALTRQSRQCKPTVEIDSDNSLEQCRPTVKAESSNSSEQCRPTVKDGVAKPPRQYLPTVQVEFAQAQYQFQNDENQDGTQDLNPNSHEATNEDTFIAPNKTTSQKKKGVGCTQL